VKRLEGTDRIWGIHAANGECIVEADAGCYPPKLEDAYLIAAGPDLLAACKAALGAFEHNHAIDWADLERAIAKAEGR